MNTQSDNQTATKKRFYSNNNNRKKATEKQLEAIRAKRETLKALSAPLKELIEIGELESINEGLRQIYQAQGHRVLKMIHQWNEEGYQVKKGEHALLLWGKPISKQIDENRPKAENNVTENKDALDFYPICFVFSNLQVTEREVKND